MGKKIVEVTFETITPLWTGNAWQEMTEIRPSSLIGSLRFWFETVMYFAGVLEKIDLGSGKSKVNLNKDELRKFCWESGNDIPKIIEHLSKEQKIPISSVIFGTTGWRSLIEIKLKSDESSNNSSLNNTLQLPYAIGINKKDENSLPKEFKTNKEWKKFIEEYTGRDFKEKLKNAKKEWSFFFFPDRYFYGEFTLEFKIPECLEESIFYPLLTFMESYGFWGGKWNLGFGRLNIKNISGKGKEWRSNVFDLKLFHKENIKIDDIVHQQTVRPSTINELAKRIQNILHYEERKVNFLEAEKKTKEYKEFIVNSLKAKYSIRNFLRHNCEEQNKFRKECFYKNKFLKGKEISCKGRKYKCEEIQRNILLRHKLLGELGEGSKLLPFFSQAKTGFLTITGLIEF